MLQIPRLGAAALAAVQVEPTLTARVAPSALRYRVQRGDTLGAIAKRFGSNTGTLRSMNGLRSDMIKVNADLMVPTGKVMTASTSGMPANRQGNVTPAKITGATTGYRVRSGDSLSTIARAHHSTVAHLKLLNGMRTDQLRINRVLRVPVMTGSSGTVMVASSIAPAQMDRHTVRSGDTLWRIAQKYDISHQALIRENGLKNGHVLKPGLVLRIPQPEATDIAGG